jgi:hypothetical protein
MQIRQLFFSSSLLLAASGCTTLPLGSGILVHPETDDQGVGVVKYRVGGYERAKQQMFTICGWWNDVQIVDKEIGSSSVEEAAVYANNVAAAGNASSADVSTVTLSFVCAERTDSDRKYQSVFPPKPKPAPSPVELSKP